MAESHLPAGDLTVLVKALEFEATDVLSVKLAALPGASLPRWTPGAHIDLHSPEGGVAQYSLCGALSETTWRIAVLLRRDGRGVSRHVHERLKPGATIRVSLPRNHFELEAAPSYFFIAGGIGITPILSMIEAANTRRIPWRLAYGGRSRDSMSFLEPLEAFGLSVDIYPEDRTGKIPLQNLFDEVDPATQVYCCGPEALMTAVESLASERGLRAPRFERFQPRTAPQSTQDASPAGFKVVLARRGETYFVPAGCSIVDALAEHGVQIPTSCREGVCGTCETRLVAGVADHRDSLLTDEERARQDVILPCVSRAQSETLTLDL